MGGGTAPLGPYGRYGYDMYVSVSVCVLAGMSSSKVDPERKNVLFNDALNTFYLRLYGVRHMVEDHSDRERKPAAAILAHSLRLAARVLLYAPSH